MESSDLKLLQNTFHKKYFEEKYHKKLKPLQNSDFKAFSNILNNSTKIKFKV